MASVLKFMQVAYVMCCLLGLVSGASINMYIIRLAYNIKLSKRLLAINLLNKLTDIQHNLSLATGGYATGISH